MESSYEIFVRTQEVLKKLEGGCSNWQEVELAWALKTLLLQTEKVDRYEGLAYRHQYEAIIDETEE